MNVRRQRAFSLVELLIVIAIIGILTALGIPALGRAKTKTRAIQCQNNIRQNSLALHMYIADNDTLADARGWWRDLAPYLAIDLKKLGPDETISLSHVWHCPGDKAFWAPHINYTQASFSYAFNSTGTGYLPERGYYPLGLLAYEANHPFLTPIRLSEIASPSEMFALGDAYASTTDGRINRHPGPAVIGVNKVPDGDADTDWLRCFTHRRLNMACADGHAENFEPKKLHEKSETFWRRWNRDNAPHMDATPSID